MMTQERSHYNDEVNLIEFIKIIYEGKWIVIAFTLIAIFIANIFISSQEPLYESRLYYYPLNEPPFKGQDLHSNFEETFFSKDTFIDWKKNTGDTTLKFDKINKDEVIDGFVYSKDLDDQFIKFLVDKETGLYIRINSNQPDILRAIFSYTNFTNELITDRYVVEAKNTLALLESSRFKILTSADISIVENILTVDDYINDASNGAKVFKFKSPTFPKKISPRSFRILALFVLFSLTISIIIVYLRHSIRKLKK